MCENCPIAGVIVTLKVPNLDIFKTEYNELHQNATSNKCENLLQLVDQLIAPQLLAVIAISPFLNLYY